jgi:hypothetical protein
MTEADLVARGKKLYEKILGAPFSYHEMVAFGRAVFNKEPWDELTPVGKVAIFRFAAAIAQLDVEATVKEAGAAPETEGAADATEEALAAIGVPEAIPSATNERPSGGEEDEKSGENKEDDGTKAA